MVVFAKQLSLENGEPLVDIVDGASAIFETKSGTSYYVKVRISEFNFYKILISLSVHDRERCKYLSKT